MQSLTTLIRLSIKGACRFSNWTVCMLRKADATTVPSRKPNPAYRHISNFGQQHVRHYRLDSIPAAAHVKSAAAGFVGIRVSTR
jgi:hypothetical protein